MPSVAYLWPRCFRFCHILFLEKAPPLECPLLHWSSGLDVLSSFGYRFEVYGVPCGKTESVSTFKGRPNDKILELSVPIVALLFAFLSIGQIYSLDISLKAWGSLG